MDEIAPELIAPCSMVDPTPLSPSQYYLRAEFPNLSSFAFPAGGGEGEKGMVLHKQLTSRYVQLHLHEWHICEPAAHTNGAHMHTLVHCSHKWECACG